MGRAYNDEKGYDRGAKGICGTGRDDDFQMPFSPKSSKGGYETGTDYGSKPIRSIADKTGVNFKTDWAEVSPAVDKNWKPGPVSSGGKWHKFNNGPPQPPATTKPVGAYSPSGKYGKKGGSGQRSGA